MSENYSGRNHAGRKVSLISVLNEKKIDQLLFEEAEARGLSMDSPLVKASRKVAISALKPMIRYMLGCEKCQIK